MTEPSIPSSQSSDCETCGGLADSSTDTYCETCKPMPDYLNETVHQRTRWVLERCAANFSITYKDGEVQRFGVLNFPDVLAFVRELEAVGLTAAYSAGSGWTFAEAPRAL